MSSFEVFLARFGLLVGPGRPSIEEALPSDPDELLEFARQNLGWLAEKERARRDSSSTFDPWILRRFPELVEEMRDIYSP